MADPTSVTGDPARPGAALPARASRRVRLARLALLWERVWPALWPPAGIAGLFLILALLDVPALLPGWAHVLLLVAFALAFLAAAVQAARSLAMPAPAAARRRVELASGLAHRPLAALQDRPVGSTGAEERALWAAHQARMRAATERLAVGLPAAGWAKRDPLALRAGLALLLVVAVVAGRNDGSQRLLRAVSPSFAKSGPAAVVALDVWINPPAYTGQPPQLLKADAPTPIAIPTGSALLAQLHGGGGTPRLVIDQAATDFTAIDSVNYRASATLTAGERLAVQLGSRTVAAWPIAIVPDEPPTVAFANPPARSERAALRLEHESADDYGLESVNAVIRRT
ncbi:MAG: DUF4175 family protein, partial [Alphaproteobacteria bacterium]|nr:DUF4175 family protein [Alphaproteobacteria bacterium]